MEKNKIRNFSIIAHIDHGKSTLADRMLECTHTVEGRNMKEQVLDSMDLERERGITIKMQPVRMRYLLEGDEYILNLIDTPGHIDFSYEVSRSLRAVEGSVVLVDSTQGIQAQTLTTLYDALDAGLIIIPVLSKIDSPLARVDEVKSEVADLLGCDKKDILETSGKTGEGVEGLLNSIIKKVSPPKISNETKDLKSLVFDFEYSDHKGVIVYTRIIEGEVKAGDKLKFCAGGRGFQALEVGIFSPKEVASDKLQAGEIGYIVTGVKEPNIVSIGDTILNEKSSSFPLPGYKSPQPIVWASIYPEGQDEFVSLRQALERLKLTDSSLSFEEESSHSLGKGFRCGFLGVLHLEIITERIKREFGLDLVITTPTVEYEVTTGKGEVQKIYSPHTFPDHGKNFSVREPWVSVKLITPQEYMEYIMPVLYKHEVLVKDSETVGESRTSLSIEMPLRELMRNFFDKIKSISSGFASISYEMAGMRDADVVRLDALIAEELMPVFSRIVSRKRVEKEAEQLVEKLHKNLPRQMFAVKVQAQALGRVISSKTISALKKDVTGYLYGGDITRKMKLREKQKKGKKKMRERGKVNVPYEVFIKMVKEE